MSHINDNLKNINERSDTIDIYNQDTESQNIDKSNNLNKSFVSKRILCELIKSDLEENDKNIANEISKKLDYLVDVILNECDHKVHYIQNFMCYIVEINSELIRLLPDYKNLKEDLNIRFIIPAKNFYNFAIEVYFSIDNLFNVNII